jgi:hypothetical protein
VRDGGLSTADLAPVNSNAWQAPHTSVGGCCTWPHFAQAWNTSWPAVKKRFVSASVPGSIHDSPR